MICFLDDWKNYPTAIVDVDTPNRSFVRLATMYRNMGVKNHAFMLALINPELKGVNPFSPNLTIDQKAAIAYECKINPWYYFREVAKAPSKVGNEAVQFEANRGNIALFWLFFNHITLFLIQIRQTGKSFSLDSLATYLLNVRCTNTQINLLTKDDTLRAANIRRLKDLDSELPEYLKQRTKNDANNLEELTVKSLGNSFLAHVPQKSPKAALKVGRGLTSPIFFIDEAPFQDNIGIAMPAALAAGTAARDMARAKGEPFGTIVTTTAGRRDDKDGKYIYGLLSNSAEWTEKFFDTPNITALEVMIRSMSRTGDLRVNCTFNHIQLGKDDKWLKRAIEDTANDDQESINRDFFNTWTVGTMSSPLPINVLEKIRQSQETPKHISVDAPYGYVTRWYIEEKDIKARLAKGSYVLGMDTSDASGGDDMSLILIDVSTGELIAAGTYNETSLTNFSRWLSTWFSRFENITGIIERKSSGVMIIDYLLEILPAIGIDPFKRLYNTAVQEYRENSMRWKEINAPLGRRSSDIYVQHKKCFGFVTTGSGVGSRSDLYSKTLQHAAKKAGDKVKDVHTINQLVGLVTLNGRVDHAPGEHDDMVIAWLLSFWLITLGQNLQHYGIDYKKIFSEAEKPQNLTPLEEFDRYEQHSIRQQITELMEQLHGERDEFVVSRMEHSLRSLNRKLVLEDGEIFSVDELINNMRQQKRDTKFNQSQHQRAYADKAEARRYGVPQGFRHEITYA